MWPTRLVYLGAKGNSQIALFGQKIDTASVGVAALFIAAVVVVISVKLVLKSLNDLRTTRFQKSVEYEIGRNRSC